MIHSSFLPTHTYTKNSSSRRHRSHFFLNEIVSHFMNARVLLALYTQHSGLNRVNAITVREQYIRREVRVQPTHILVGGEWTIVVMRHIQPARGLLRLFRHNNLLLLCLRLRISCPCMFPSPLILDSTCLHHSMLEFVRRSDIFGYMT